MFLGYLVMAGLVAYGAYLAYKVREIDRKIARHRSLSREGGDGR